MRITRYGRVAAVVATGAMMLSACGSDSNDEAGAENTASASASSSASTEASTAAADDCGTGTLNAEGSSAQKNAIEEAIASYNEKCADLTINYNPTGSGAGITQFNAGQVDFAGSDSALKADKGEVAAAKQRCSGNDAWNIPMVAGPITIAFKLKGVDKLVLTPSVAAQIFTGKIKTWNDPAIAKINSGVSLPSEPVKVFFRSDESGTTENFEKYLAAAAPQDWTKEPSKVWAGTGEGKEKSAGVAEGVGTTEGGVTYVEWSYATDSKLGIAQIDNGAGPVELTGESAGKAVAAATADGTGNDLRLKLDYATKADGAYPIVLVTYEIVCSKGLGADKTTAIKSFLKFFASADEQKALQDVGYAPLPAEVQTKVSAAIDAIAP